MAVGAGGSRVIEPQVTAHTPETGDSCARPARLAQIYDQLAHGRSGRSSKLEQVVSRDSDMVTPGSLSGLGLQCPLIHLRWEVGHRRSLEGWCYDLSQAVLGFLGGR